MDASNLKALVIDDHQLSRKLLGLQLRAFGIQEIEFCVNGEDGLKALHDAHFDVVMLDWSMPGLDGLELLEQAQSSENFKSVAFVMVSAEAQPDQIVKALNAGAVAYITKPIKQDEIDKKMTQVIEWLSKNAA